MKSLVFATVAMSAGIACALPTVSDVTTEQNAANRRVTITYNLTGEAGVVTADVRTNRGDGVYISIGDSHLKGLSGDVNRKVEVGKARKIVWNPRKDWVEGGFKTEVKVFVTAWSMSAPPNYMAIDLEVPGQVAYYTSTNALPKSIDDDCWRTRYLLMRKIPAKGVTWTRGKYQTTSGACKQHLVQLTHDYYLGVFEMTAYQYKTINGTSEWSTSFANENCRATRPVNNIATTWPSGAVTKLGTLSGLGSVFSLPTDAQWEYAARAGQPHEYTDGNDPSGAATDANLAKLARYSGNAGSGYDEATCDTSVGTARVGSYAPNAWGLYDMLGNVREAVKDYFTSSGWANYATDKVYVDPTGPESGEGNTGALRGGSYLDDAKACYLGNCTQSSYNRWLADKYTGFRMCMTLAD